MDSRRIASLDSLRGIAAFLVVLTHCAGVYAPPPAWVTSLPLSVLLWAGHGFVLVFFALSGYVLFMPFARANIAYGPYIVKRFARIYPPFLVAILLSAVLYVLVRPVPVPHLSDWFNRGSWSQPPTLHLIAGHLAMTDVRELHSLDNVMWSLVHELRISILFPLIAACVRRNWQATTMSLFVVSVFAAWSAQHHHFAIAGFNPASTARYLFLFAAGAALCLNAAQIRRWLASVSGGWIALAIAMSLAIIASPLEEAAPTIIAGSFAALVLVGLCAAGAADALLLRSFPLWLGRVSYSLYLVHLIVLLTLVHLLAGRLPMLVILTVSAMTSLGVAELMYRWVEEPSIAIGRRAAQWLTSHAAAPAPLSQTLKTS